MPTHPHTPTSPTQWLRPADVEHLYNIPRKTLQAWRDNRRHNRPGEHGPTFITRGRSITYRTTDIDTWLTAHEVH